MTAKKIYLTKFSKAFSISCIIALLLAPQVYASENIIIPIADTSSTGSADGGYSFDFGTVTDSVFTNTWANISISIPHGFTSQTGKAMYDEIYYEPQDAVFDGLQATDLLIVCPEYMEAYINDDIYELEDNLIFALMYMPENKADGTKLENTDIGPGLAMAALGVSGYEEYVEQGTKTIGGYSYDSFIFDYGNAVKTDYRAKNPGKESPLLEEDIRIRAEVDIRTLEDKKIILLTLTTGKYYGEEELISGGIRNIRGTYNG